MKTAVILGSFDGLHPGHLAVLKSALPYKITALTFSIPPKMSMGDSTGLILLPEDKYTGLSKLGVSDIEMLDFEQVRSISPNEFLNKIWCRYAPARICCGYNYRFGSEAKGDIKLLSSFCRDNNIEFCCTDCVSENGTPISSTLLRIMLKNGELEKANRYIYGGFGFKSAVLHGDARGRTIGFPTINQKYPPLLAPLKPGVYISKVEVEGKSYDGISNIGVRPTFLTSEIYAETYIRGFSGDIYGQSVLLKPQRFLRSEQKFGSVDELKYAISRDIAVLDE